MGRGGHLLSSAFPVIPEIPAIAEMPHMPEILNIPDIPEIDSVAGPEFQSYTLDLGEGKTWRQIKESAHYQFVRFFE